MLCESLIRMKHWLSRRFKEKFSILFIMFCWPTTAFTSKTLTKNAPIINFIFYHSFLTYLHRSEFYYRRIHALLTDFIELMHSKVSSVYVVIFVVSLLFSMFHRFRQNIQSDRVFCCLHLYWMFLKLL